MSTVLLAGLGQPEQLGRVGLLEGPGALSQVAQQVRDVCLEVGGLLKLRTPSPSALHPPLWMIVYGDFCGDSPHCSLSPLLKQHPFQNLCCSTACSCSLSSPGAETEACKGVPPIVPCTGWFLIAPWHQGASYKAP